MSSVSGDQARDVLIRLRGVPVGLFKRSAAYHEELMRECSLLLVSEPTVKSEVPGHLLQIAAQLRDNYQPEMAPESQVEMAESAGRSIIDLDIAVHESVADDVERLGAAFDAAERYSVGGKLLTMAPPSEITRFRRWYVAEIAGQLRGSPPTPWNAD